MQDCDVRTAGLPVPPPHDALRPPERRRQRKRSVAASRKAVTRGSTSTDTCPDNAGAIMQMRALSGGRLNTRFTRDEMTVGTIAALRVRHHGSGRLRQLQQA